ncbi:MAG TPA: class I SAM-dependent methyltransferase [Longimicrobiales bacterium]|nr:class I SAM-dependent methyltransferase [Longimicrobiales bacterium]
MPQPSPSPAEAPADASTSTAAEEGRIRRVYAARRDDGRYSWLSPGHLFLLQERERAVLALFRRECPAGLAGLDVLDLGCGTGFWLRELVKWGAAPERLVGVDLLPERVERARALGPPGAGLHCASAAATGLPAAGFDLVLQSMVFTSILSAELRAEVAREMLRLVRPAGFVLWYDFRVNNPANPAVRGVGRREIGRLFPGCRIRLRSVTLAPPLARRLAPRCRLLAEGLALLPPLRTHYLGVIRPGGPDEG